MRVLAASFPDDASARAARAQLLRALDLDASQIGVEALAPERGTSNAAILAGRFQEDVVDAARAVVEQHQGRLVIDIDDAGNNA
jgi:hypothetical protein